MDHIESTHTSPTGKVIFYTNGDMQVWFSVTPEDIEEGIPAICGACPVALAIQRELREAGIKWHTMPVARWVNVCAEEIIVKELITTPGGNVISDRTGWRASHKHGDFDKRGSDESIGTFIGNFDMKQPVEPFQSEVYLRRII